MEAATGASPGTVEKARAFGDYLEQNGLSADRVPGDLGPAQIEDVISFLYAGMPDRYKDEREAAPLPEEHRCAAASPRRAGYRAAWIAQSPEAPPKSKEGKVAAKREPFWYYDAEDDNYEEGDPS